MFKSRLFDKEKEVQRRYWRRKTRQHLMPKIKQAIRFKFRITNRRRERKSLKEIDQTIEVVAAALNRLKRNEAHSIYTIYNATLYYLLAMRDIQIVKVDAIAHPDESVRKFAIRIIALTVSEFDMSKVIEREFQQALVDLSISDEIKESLVISLRRLNKAQQKSQNRFKDLRINVIAHRDKDSLNQYNLINKIEDLETIQSAFEFFDEIKIVSEMLVRCCRASGSQSSLIAQAARITEKRGT